MTKKEAIRRVEKVTPTNGVLTQKRPLWLGHAMRREDTHATRETKYKDDDNKTQRKGKHDMFGKQVGAWK